MSTAARVLPGPIDGPCLIGMVHLAPVLDGGVALAGVEAAAVRDAERLAAAGFDAVVIENFGDRPFFPDRVPPHTITGMTRIADAVRRAVGGRVAIGLNVLRNDARAALAIAAAVDAAFVRVNVHVGAAVTDQGLVSGLAHETVRYRNRIAPDCAIWADVRVKHAAPIVARSLGDEARETYERGAADALIVSGTRTGAATDPGRANEVRRAVPGCPLLVGSGATPEALAALSPWVDGYIVGTWLKEGGEVGNAVDEQRARDFVAAARRA